MIYAKRDIELGDEITYGKSSHWNPMDHCLNSFDLQITTFPSNKTRSLVYVDLPSAVAISIRLVIIFTRAFSLYHLLSSQSPHNASYLYYLSVSLAQHATRPDFAFSIHFSIDYLPLHNMNQVTDSIKYLALSDRI